jgi:hypothetical protein
MPETQLPDFLEDAGELHAAGAHTFDVGLRAGVAVFEGSLFFRLAPEDFVIAIAVERRIDVDQIHAMVGQLGELFEVVAAIDDAGVEQCRRFTRFDGSRRGRDRFAGKPLLGHARRITRQIRWGNVRRSFRQCPDADKAAMRA